MAKLIIPSKYAEMIQPFTSGEKTRYYLCGFNVKPHAQGGVLICATDGHTLGLFHAYHGAVECHDIANGDVWVLAKDTVKACKEKRDTFERWLVILPQAEGMAHNLSIVLAGDAEEAEVVAREASDPDLILHTAIIRPIDGTFPDYDHVIPFDGFGEQKSIATFNGDYLAKFAKVSKTENPLVAITIHARGETSSAIVQTSRDDFLGVIMPVTSALWESIPDWYANKSAPLQAVAAE